MPAEEQLGFKFFGAAIPRLVGGGGGAGNSGDVMSETRGHEASEINLKGTGLIPVASFPLRTKDFNLDI